MSLADVARAEFGRAEVARPEPPFVDFGLVWGGSDADACLGFALTVLFDFGGLSDFDVCLSFLLVA